MTNNLTPSDLQLLERCQSSDEWREACNTIKARYGGGYPADWFSVVIKGGLGDRITARWGQSMTIRQLSPEETRRFVGPRCKGCGKHPSEIEEYVELAHDEPEEYPTPADAVKENEGTWNTATGKFWCTTCYIRAGCPEGEA